MPTKVLTMFQPAPVAPQVAPSGHRIQSAPSVDGPWIGIPATIVHNRSTVDCEVLALKPDGTSRYPTIDFTKGDCFGVTATAAPTDTHVRAQAYAMVNGVEVTQASNVQAVPEPHVGAWFFLLVLAFMAFIGTDPNHPTRRR